MDEAELAFVATMRDEASAVAKQARRTIDSTGGVTKSVEIPLKVRDDASARLKSVAGTLDDVGRKSIANGKKLTAGITLPLVAMGVGIAKTSIEFSRGMGNVASLLPGNTKRVAQLREEVLKLGPETGASLGDLSQGLYQSLSAFGDTADAATILENNAKAARAGAASVTDAINLTSAVTKAYGDSSAKAVSKASDLALLTVRMGQTTFPELAGSVGMVTPLTNELRVSQEELFATMGTLTGVTGGASEVATQLRGSLQSLMAPTADTAKALKAHGYESGKALIQDKGLAGAIGFLVNEADKSGKPLQSYISSIEGQVAALALAGPQSDKYRETLKAMNKAQGTTEEAFKASTEGVGEAAFTWDQAKAQAAAIAVELGDGFAPALRDLLIAGRPVIDWAIRMAQSFADADPQTQKIVATVLALTAAIGPLLIAFGSVARGASSIVTFASTVVGGLERVRASLRTTGVEADVASAKVSRVGGIARGAAGVAGLGALAVGASTSNDALGLLSSAGGGAMMGFAVGGPIGAAIGGGAGALLHLATNAGNAGTALEDAKPPAVSFADSLDRVTGAATTATREVAYLALQESGVASAAQELGFSQRELVDALTGTGNTGKATRGELEGLIASLHGVGDAQAPFKQGTPEWEEWRNNVHKVNNAMDDLGYTLGEDQKKTRDLYRATAPLKELYKGLPPRVLTRIEQKGEPQSRKGIARLANAYRLTPKEVRTLIRASGVPATVKQIQNLRGNLEKTAQTKGDLRGYSKGIDAGTRAAATTAKRGATNVRKNAEGEVKRTKADLGTFKSSVKSGSSSAASTARSGGHQVGSELKAGIISGFAGTQAILSQQAAAAVRAAVASARAAAKSKSPSREFYDVGRDMGRGQVNGHRDEIPRMVAAARDGVRAVLGITVSDLMAGQDQVGTVLDSIGDRIEKSYTKQLRGAARRKLAQADTKAEKARARKLLESVDERAEKLTRTAVKNLRDETRAVRANAAARQVQVDALKAANEQGAAFAQQLRDYGSVTNTSAPNDAPITAGFILQDLDKRLAAVTDFRKNLQSLRDRGLDESIVDRLEADGVENAGAHAAALANATAAQLAQLETVTGQINTQATLAGTQSVAGLVAGINAELARVDRAGALLAKALLRAIRRELKIKSPSRAVRGDMRMVGKGAELGLVDSIAGVERASVRLAQAATPTPADLSMLANAQATRTLAMRSSETITVRHEVVSPDGSLDGLTAAQIAELLNGDTAAQRVLEGALARVRARRTERRIVSSD